MQFLLSLGNRRFFVFHKRRYFFRRLHRALPIAPLHRRRDKSVLFGQKSSIQSIIHSTRSYTYRWSSEPSSTETRSLKTVPLLTS